MVYSESKINLRGAHKVAPLLSKRIDYGNYRSCVCKGLY